MPRTDDLTKGQKRELQRIAGLAYERELSAALSDLEAYFQRWRAGEIEPHDVSEAIHAFHQGPSRTLWSRYTHDGEYAAIAAVAKGVVRHDEVAADLLEVIKHELVALESRKDRKEL
jgi:hypothetical protein